MAFTGDLWGRLSPTGNLALSPYSIAVALAMTANGAAGVTQSQMLDVLHVRSLATHNSGLAALARSLEALAGSVPLADGTRGRIDLACADQLFGDAATEFGRAFLTVLAQEYDAGMRTVDFQHDPEGSRAAINGWTAEQTHERIPTILPLGSVRCVHPPGAGQRAVLQGAVAHAVREGGDHTAALPSRRRLAGRRTDDAGGRRTERRTSAVGTGAAPGCRTPAARWR